MSKTNFFKSLEQNGVKILDKKSTFIDENCVIGANTVIYPNNIIKNNTKIGENCVIESNNYISNSKIGNNNKIIFSYIINSKINNDNNIGPYSYLKDAEIYNFCEIGNFVKIEASKILNYVKASQLSYIVDAEIGELSNIGCGVIFCNFNGKDSFKSKVGKNCFIASNVNIIAPIEIGDNCYVCAGATLYKNIESNKFVITNRELNIKEDFKKIHIKNKN